MEVVRANGLDVAYEPVGEGPPLVLVHGAGWTPACGDRSSPRHRRELVSTLILVDTYAGWKGSLPRRSCTLRVAGVQKMFAAADHLFDPTLPGLYAGDPPTEVRAASRGDGSRRSPRKRADRVA